MVKEVIPTKVHGVVDYATSGALLAAPELFRLKDVPSSARAPRVAGAATTAYSALTDYELGVVKALPMRAHLALDAASGALLALSPWVLGYRKHGTRHWLPHTLVGVSEVAVALTSRTDGNGGGRRRRVGKGVLVALAVAAPLAGGVAAWRRRSQNGSGGTAFNGGDGGEMYASDAMASVGDPPAQLQSEETPEPAQAS